MLLLPFLSLKVKLQAILWQWRVKKSYYHNVSFKKSDEALLKAYLFKSPYYISKSFMKERGEEDIHVYGETPIKVYDQMASRWNIGKEHRFVELGCGRGRGLSFLSDTYGCKSVGIEWIQEFVEIAKKVIPSVKIYHEDFMTSQKIYGDFIYLYGTCLEEDKIMILCERLLKLPKESKVITVSFSLSEYHDAFKVIDHFDALFPWGYGSVFLNQIGEE